MALRYQGTPVDYWLNADDRLIATAIRKLEEVDNRG